MRNFSVSRRDFVRHTALWMGTTGVGLTAPGEASPAQGPTPSAADADTDSAPPVERAPTQASDSEKELIASVLAFVREEHIEFFGIGKMSAAYETIERTSRRKVASELRLPRAIALAFTRPTGSRNGLTTKVLQRGLPGEFALRPRLSPATQRLCELLTARGYRAETSVAGVSGLPKMAGRLAGLGWIGRSSMLIIPGAGPRVALAAVLTDAPLPPTCETPMEDHCDNCRRCVDACPAKAYTGERFRETDPLAVRFDTEKCSQWCEKLLKERGVAEVCTEEGVCSGGICNLCVTACPYGQGRCLLPE